MDSSSIGLDIDAHSFNSVSLEEDQDDEISSTYSFQRAKYKVGNQVDEGIDMEEGDGEEEDMTAEKEVELQKRLLLSKKR